MQQPPPPKKNKQLSQLPTKRNAATHKSRFSPLPLINDDLIIFHLSPFLSGTGLGQESDSGLFPLLPFSVIRASLN